jgi:hypothetical protein
LKASVLTIQLSILRATVESITTPADEWKKLVVGIGSNHFRVKNVLKSGHKKSPHRRFISEGMIWIYGVLIDLLSSDVKKKAPTL